MFPHYLNRGGNIMALINRVSRLFKADFHAVLDQIEEPEQLLKQAIRDMEDELQSAEQGIANCRQEQDALCARVAEMRSSIDDLDEQLDLCFESGKDDLAKGLIRRKLEAERILKRLNSRFESNGTFLDEQRKLTDDNRRTLDGLRQKADVFAQRPSTHSVDFDDNAWLAREMSVGDDEVEIAWLREKAQRSGS
jgi:phage shock protein A